MVARSASKEELIEQLLEAKRKGQRAELALRFQGEDARAEDVRAANRGLSRHIDDLLVAAMKKWKKAAAPRVTRVKSINAKLQRRIRDIKNEIAIAKKTIEVVRLIDDAAQMAAEALGR